MNYDEMFGEWNQVLKRSVLAFHHLCFAFAVVTFLAVLTLPYVYSSSPGAGEFVGAFLGGLIGFALIDAMAVAGRYAVEGDIKLFPSWTLDAYFPPESPNSKERAKEGSTANQAAKRASVEAAEDVLAASQMVERLGHEGVSGVWDVELDSSFGALSIVLQLSQSGTKLTGTVEGSLFKPMKIEGGSISQGVATWKATATEPAPMTLEFSARIEGDTLSGEASFGEYGDGKLSGGRRGTASAASAGDSGTGFAPLPFVERRRESIPPEAISPELRPIIEELGLVENCRQLAEEGWTIIENVADPEFIARLRQTIVDSVPLDATGAGNAAMLLGKDPVYAEAVLNPKVLAMAEFSVGRGCLLGSDIATIRSKGSPALELHSDQDMFPAPLPAHNMMLTACWVLDDFTKEGGATRVLPGTNRLLRHPTEEETRDETSGIAMDCRAGSVALWDGRVWHGNWPRTIDGLRVAVHTSYYRLLMRPGEDYSDVADELIATYGEPMSTLLGREDYMYKKNYDYVKDFPRFTRTLNNAKS